MQATEKASDLLITCGPVDWSFRRPEPCSYSGHVHTSNIQIHISAVLCAGQTRDFLLLLPTSEVGPVYYTDSDLRSIKAVELHTLGFKQCCSSWGLPVQNHKTNVRLVKVMTDVAGTGSLIALPTRKTNDG